MKKINFKKGFTLIELLVVIGIIAILIALGASSYSTAQKKARDARRKGDLKAIANSLEQYYSICGYSYPIALGTSIACASPAVTVMATVPKDPSNSTTPNYVYTQPNGTSTFQVCTTLESETVTNFCLTNQQ